VLHETVGIRHGLMTINAAFAHRAAGGALAGILD